MRSPALAVGPDLRRKVIEAEKAAPGIARQAIERVGALYSVERQAVGLSAAERLKLRQEKSAPMLLELREKLPVWKEQLFGWLGHIPGEKSLSR
jgi:hypothetical protein